MCAEAISTPGTARRTGGRRLAWSASAVSVRVRSIRRTDMASASCSAISSTSPTSARLKYPRDGSRARVSTP